MNRRGAFITGIIVSVVMAVAGGFVADIYLRNSFGIGLFDLYDFLTVIGVTNDDLPTLDEVKPSIGISMYNDLVLERGNLTMMFNLSSSNLEAVNSNEELGSILSAALGADYNIYLFSVQTIGNLSFKVFEWSIKVNDGDITEFSSGRIFESYNVRVQLSHDVAMDLMRGQVQPSNVKNWIQGKSVRINPITEATRVINALPQIIETIQSYM